MITFFFGNLICVAFSFFSGTVASADTVGGPEKGRFFYVCRRISVDDLRE